MPQSLLQQTRKAWLGTYLDCITPKRFGVGGTDKGATKYRGSMSNQLTVFSSRVSLQCIKVDILGSVTNFIRPYLHQFSIDSHGLNGYGKPLKRPFDRYQSRLEAISNGRDIRQINW